MLKMRIIPCLDVKDGRVVKGINFVDLVDAGDPVAQARVYDRAGADELTFLDITASSDGRDTLYDVVARAASSRRKRSTTSQSARRASGALPRIIAKA